MIDEQFIGGGQEEADRGHRLLRRKVVIGRLHGHPTPAPAGKRADLDRRLGIQRDTQFLRRRIGLGIYGTDLGKDGVGLGHFFWGCVLATFVRV